MRLKLPYLPPWKRRSFWGRINRAGPNDCWPWQGAIQRNGYGNLRLGSHTYQAHRIAYWLTTHEDPGELDVLHTCDNRPCCNPGHLFIGDNTANVADRVAKGRNNTSPLTARDIRSIRIRASRRERQRDIAADLGISQATVSNIVNRKTWRHV